MISGSQLFGFAAACTFALSTSGVAAQTASVVLRPGVTLPPGAKVLNPGARQQFVRPASGLVQEPGRRFHTNVELLVPKGGYKPMFEPSVGPPTAGELFQTPASLACAYGLVPASNGCNPNLVKTNPSGGSKAIAIVDAYDTAGAATDLTAFNAQFGLPNGFFTKIYGTGDPALGCKNRPPAHGGDNERHRQLLRKLDRLSHSPLRS